MALLLHLAADGYGCVEVLRHAIYRIAEAWRYDEDMPTTSRPPAVAHTVRVPDALWNAALTRATENDETLSVVIRRALRTYLDDGDAA